MKAFKNAIANNYGIELDVRITKDKQVVVFHDKNLLRVCGIKKKIANQTYENLKKYKLYKSNQHIPLFKDVLKLVDGKVPILVEIKNYGKVGEFEELVYNELKDYQGNFAVCSFNIEVVKWFKKNKPNVKRGFIYGDLHKFGIKKYKTVYIYRILRSKPDFISLDYKLIHTLLPRITKLFKKPLTCWTIDNKKKLVKANKISDNIIFENIKHLRSIK